MPGVKDILVVDDSRTELVFLRSLLTRNGYHVRTAENAEQALLELGEQLPDLILMDVVMPVMDGIEATRQIKKMGGEKWVPLIIMTSLTGNNEIIEGFTAGADDYLVKPMDLNVLEARMRSM